MRVLTMIIPPICIYYSLDKLLSTICNKDKQRMLVTKPSMLLYGHAGPNNIC